MPEESFLLLAEGPAHIFILCLVDAGALFFNIIPETSSQQGGLEVSVEIPFGLIIEVELVRQEEVSLKTTQ